MATFCMRTLLSPSAVMAACARPRKTPNLRTSPMTNVKTGVKMCYDIKI